MKTVQLVTCKDESVTKVATLLGEVIEARPDSVFILYRKNGAAYTCGAFMNRVEMMGAAQAAILEMWKAP